MRALSNVYFQEAERLARVRHSRLRPQGALSIAARWPMTRHLNMMDHSISTRTVIDVSQKKR